MWQDNPGWQTFRQKSGKLRDLSCQIYEDT
jgi:hypothetical protein